MQKKNKINTCTIFCEFFRRQNVPEQNERKKIRVNVFAQFSTAVETFLDRITFQIQANSKQNFSFSTSIFNFLKLERERWERKRKKVKKKHENLSQIIKNRFRTKLELLPNYTHTQTCTVVFFFCKCITVLRNTLIKIKWFEKKIKIFSTPLDHLTTITNEVKW